MHEVNSLVTSWFMLYIILYHIISISPSNSEIIPNSLKKKKKTIFLKPGNKTKEEGRRGRESRGKNLKENHVLLLSFSPAKFVWQLFSKTRSAVQKSANSTKTSSKVIFCRALINCENWTNQPSRRKSLNIDWAESIHYVHPLHSTLPSSHARRANAQSGVGWLEEGKSQLVLSSRGRKGALEAFVA